MRSVTCSASVSACTNGVLLSFALTQAAAAGTTIINHGFSPNPVPGSGPPPRWMETMARAILLEAGDTTECGDLAGTPLGTVLEYDPASGQWQHVCGSTSPNGEIILLFNWVEESDGLNLGGTQGYTEHAGDVLYAALRDPQVPAAFSSVDLLNRVHFIGHSRGTVVNSECVERLAAAGIVIDHVTTMDPHPVNGTLDPVKGDFADWGDPTPQQWDHVTWADNYYRADGGGLIHSLDFDGITIDGACRDIDVGVVVEPGNDADPVPALEHIEVHAWYHGTIDQAAADDGAGTIIEPIEDGLWYGVSGIPARNMVGFFHTNISGGARPCADASGEPPSSPCVSPRTVYNGDFEIVNTIGPDIGVGWAGWAYQGGNRDAAIGLPTWTSTSPPPGSTYYAQVESVNPILDHNWFYVDQSVIRLELDRRVTLASATDRFKISLVDDTGTAHELADQGVVFTTGWDHMQLCVPPERRGQSYRLRLELADSGNPGTIEAIVDVDNIALQLSTDPAVYEDDFETGALSDNWSFEDSTDQVAVGSNGPGEWSSELVTTGPPGECGTSARLRAHADVSTPPYQVNAAIRRTVGTATHLFATLRIDDVQDSSGTGHSFFQITLFNANDTSQAISYGFSTSGDLGGDIEFAVSPPVVVDFEADYAQDFLNKYGTPIGDAILRFRASADFAESNPPGNEVRTADVTIDNVLVATPAGCEAPCKWDCGDGDGTVGIVDFLALLGQWGQNDTSCDFDGGGVDIVDFLKLLSNWGPCPD